MDMRSEYPSSRGWPRGRIRILLIACALLLSACGAELEKAGGAGESGVSAKVEACNVDPALQTATADVTVTATSRHLLVSLSAKVVDPAGNVLGQSSGTVSNVEPGHPAQTRISFSLDAPPQGTPTCTVAVESTA